jgi:hypothetical protein
MSASDLDSVASPPAGRGFWGTMRRLAPLRLLVSGFVGLVFCALAIRAGRWRAPRFRLLLD